MDSAKGWAGVMRYSPAVWEQLKAFYDRDDTFSLGVCNGCQLMAMLVDWKTGRAAESPDWGVQTRFVRNTSGRFESRFSTASAKSAERRTALRTLCSARLGKWSANASADHFLFLFLFLFLF